MISHGLLQFGKFSIEPNLPLLLALVIAAAWFDIKARRIPNWLVLTGLIASFGINIFFGNLAAWACGLLVGFGCFFPLYLLRAMGAGDVKLMAMVGAFLGPIPALESVLTIVAAGGVLALAAALRSGVLRDTLANVQFMLVDAAVKVQQGAGAELEPAPASAGSMPYAVAIATGTVIHLVLEKIGYAVFT